MQPEREFIHDLLSPLMVVQGRVKMILKKITADPDNIDVEKVVTDLGKVGKAADKLNDIIQERRSQNKATSEAEG